MVVTDYDADRARFVVDSIPHEGRYIARRIDASSAAAITEAAPRVRRRPGHERGRPAVRDADLRRRAGRERQLHGHGDEPVAAQCRKAHSSSRASSSATSNLPRQPSGSSAGGWRWSAWAWIPVCRTSSPPRLRSNLFDADGVDEVHIRDGGDLAIPGFAFAPVFSIWTTIEECLNPPIVWNDGEWQHHRAVQRGRDVPLSRGHRRGRVRERRARGGAARAALAEVAARHLQVRAGQRTSSRSCARSTRSAWTAPTRSGQGSRGRRRVMFSPRSRPIRPSWAIG